jgi:thiol-disulfide isomerase/thioredoxin
MSGAPPGTRRLVVAGAVAGLGSVLTSSCAPAATVGPGLSQFDARRKLLDRRDWLNSAPLAAKDLQGRVVLVNIWTYSCINSLRPLPYVRAWAEKYRDRGLLVVGVHTPEFAFERDPANVRAALTRQGVTYPVVLDNDYAIWNAFANDAWPAFYFIDAQGQIKGRKAGEGGYQASERLLQQLLSAARGGAVGDPLVDVVGAGDQASPDWDDLDSSETYVGYARATGFASVGGVRRDSVAAYERPAQLPRNQWGLAGAWNVGSEFATVSEPGARIAFRFHARDLNLILGPPPNAGPARIRVRLDGAAPGPNHGDAIDAAGDGLVDQPRMYQLVRQTRPVADSTCEIEFLDSGARAYDFTFG